MGKMHGGDIIDDANIASDASKITTEITTGKNNLKFVRIKDYKKEDEKYIKSFVELFYTSLDDSNINFLHSKYTPDNKRDYYLLLSSEIKNLLGFYHIGPQYIFLYLGKRNIDKMTSGETIFFEKLNDDDCMKIRDKLEKNLYIKNPDISGGKRKQQTMRNKKVHCKIKTMKRAKIQKTKRHKRVIRRKSKKYI
jgi:hypothetical protein